MSKKSFCKTLLADQLGKSQAIASLLSQKIDSNLIEVAPYLSDDQANTISTINNPASLSDKTISLMNISTKEKQDILDEVNIKIRLEKSTVIINRENFGKKKQINNVRVEKSQIRDAMFQVSSPIILDNKSPSFNSIIFTEL